MKIIYVPSFTRDSKKLSSEIKSKANKAIEIFKNNPSDPRLRTHKLQGRLCDYWAFSVDYEHRIIFRYGSGKEVFLITVGDHDIYK